MAHADEQDCGGAQRRGEADQQSIAALEEGEAHARGHSFARASEEPVRLARLLAEGLDDAQRSEGFLHDGERRALQLLCLQGLAPHARAVDAGEEEEGWRDDQRDERQLPIEPHRHGDHRHQRGRGGDGGNDAVCGDGLDGERVLVDPVERVRGSARIVARNREALDLMHQPRAEVERQALPDRRPQQRAGECRYVSDHGDGDQERDGKDQDRRRGIRCRSDD